ncbi:MAG: hypothetical protein WD072_05335 [Pirellulales bacterium]
MIQTMIHQTIQKTLLAVAIVAVAATLASPVIAGGGSGGSKGSIPVRIKNVGVSPVGANALSGSASTSQLFQGARVVAANGVTQFSVRAGAFTAVAADPDQPLVVNKVRSFNTRAFKTIYLYAQQDTETATLVGAPGGVKF